MVGSTGWGVVVRSRHFMTVLAKVEKASSAQSEIEIPKRDAIAFISLNDLLDI